MEGFAHIITVSLVVCASATVIATCLGVPLAAALAMTEFPGGRAIVVTVNALLGLPPVVVGLGLYLLLSRSGPFGRFGILFTPPAMVVAQSVLAVPIVAALAHRALQTGWRRYGREFQGVGASRWQALPVLLTLQRRPLATTVLAGFGRTISEVGAILIVGGNIDGVTRTMTTAIALETSKGNLELALALGGVLIAISLGVSAGVLWLIGRQDR